MVKVRDKSELVVVNAGENLEKLMAKKFMRPTKHAILLPYFDELETEVDQNFQQIINGLVAALLTENPFEAVDYYDVFSRSINHFGLRMSKEKCLNLIRFFYEVIIKKDQRVELIQIACGAFVHVIKQIKEGSLGWRDLTLEWRPIFELYLRAMNRKIKPNPLEYIQSAAVGFSIFYPPQEHPAIWETILQELSTGNTKSMERFSMLCWSFLAIQGMSEDEIKKYAENTWIKNLWEMYLKADMNTTWTSVFVDYFSELAIHAPGAIDLSPYYDVLYTKTMRSFNLTVREGKVAVGDGQESSSIAHLASVCAYTIGGPKSSLSHFQRLMHYILFNVHPMNSGDHSQQIGSFLLNFIRIFKFRIKDERLKFNKRSCRKEFYLTDSDIDAVTESLVDIVIMLLFSDSFQYDYKLIQTVTTLNREYVAPKLLDHLYSSLTAVNEPHRLTIIIETFSSLIFDVIRQPDAEFRAPRDITYDSTWLKFLEQERKQWATYQLGSEVAEIETHTFKSLRAHAFYIMEIFANNINVNDVDRTTFILKTLVILFSSFPLMDFSSAIKYHGSKMSEDDRILCLLSKRVPHLVEFTFTKVLDVISCLAVCPPNNSGGAAVASMSSESVQQEGNEEIILKSGINQLVRAIFDRADGNIKQKLLERLFNYLTTVEFSSFMATELLTSLVSSSLWINRDAYRRFAEFVSKKLKTLITDEERQSKTPSSSVIFYVLLSKALFGVTHSMILENEQLLFETIELLLSCESKAIHKCGTEGVNSLLYVVLSIRTEADASPENEMFKKPLEEWNPIQYWAKCNSFKETVITWYVPAKSEIECAQRIAHRFFFPFITSLQTGTKDRDTVRRILHHLKVIASDINVLNHPSNIKKISDIYTPYCLPEPPSSLGSACILQYELTSPNGENVRELLLSMVESMMKCTHDPTALTYLSTIAFSCMGRSQDIQLDAEIEKGLSDTNLVLLDSTYCRASKASQHTMYELAFIKHVCVQAYHGFEMRSPNQFDQRVLDCLGELALNDYEKVRDSARSCLQRNSSQILRCRHLLIPKVTSVLSDPSLQNTDRLAGAMSLLLDLGWMDSANPKLRLDLWDAVLRIKVMDDLKICSYYEEICQAVNSVDKNPTYRCNRETYTDRNKKASETARLVISKTETWEPFLSESSLNRQIDVWIDFEKSRQTLGVELVDLLFKNHIRNSSHHHTREKLARSMVYCVQKENFDGKSIKLLLSQLVDEEYDARKEARDWLALWMRRNKPKTIRVNMKPPGKVDHGVPMESGIREDNLWIAYDSENLPKSEDRWNDMIFVEKEKGSCTWPSSISVVRKRKDGPPLESKSRTPSDVAILEFFSNPTTLTQFLEYRLLEKDSSTSINYQVCQLFKYVIRNYPEEAKPLKLLTEALKQFLNSKKKNEQLLCAELFVGVVQGLKHRTFKELDAFWIQITAQMDKFLNTILVETDVAWSMAFALVLDYETDLRRQWWLIETMINWSRKGTSATEFHQAFCLGSLMFKRWRYGEIMNRVSIIAWNKLNLALTDSLRCFIARALRSSTFIREINATATFINVPDKFVTDTVDSTIQKIIQNIPQLKHLRDSTQDLVKSSKSDTVLASPTGNSQKTRQRKRQSSLTGDFDNKTSMAHFRCLLEYILQYYENSMYSWTPALVSILPKLMKYANEDDYDLSEETHRDVDISQNASLIIHDYMSGAWLKDQFLDDIVKSWRMTFSNFPQSYRVRIAVIKFIQASVYSNMYPMCIESRRDQVEKLLFEAVFDRNISVRKEAAKCLLLFIHCEYINVSDEKVDELAIIFNSKSDHEANVHGAALALGTIIIAYPFSLPAKILKPMRILNASKSMRAVVRQTVTDIMREFRRQHRDDWEKTKLFLGERFVFDIENATAPAYYV